MKVRDMFREGFCDQYGDVDVYDDCVEELGIAFCGDTELTKEGLKKYALVLEDDVTINDGIAVVHIDDYPDCTWQKHLRALCELFEDVAGFCSMDEWNVYFKEV